MNTYLAVIGDIISSREVEERHALQAALEEAFQALNDPGESASGPPDPSAEALLSPFTLTLGDEFQAVYKNADRVIRDSLYILEAAHPHQVRFSYGVGTMDTDINTDQAIGMDGPAFHRARDGIEALKEEKEDYLFSLSGISDPLNAALYNQTLRLNTAVYRNMYAGSLREIEAILTTITRGIDRDLEAS